MTVSGSEPTCPLCSMSSELNLSIELGSFATSVSACTILWNLSSTAPSVSSEVVECFQYRSSDSSVQLPKAYFVLSETKFNFPVATEWDRWLPFLQLMNLQHFIFWCSPISPWPSVFYIWSRSSLSPAIFLWTSCLKANPYFSTLLHVFCNSFWIARRLVLHQASVKM